MINKTDTEQKIFTRDDIVKMTSSEYKINEKIIWEQLKKGLIK